MDVVETELPGVLLVQPRVHADERGVFLESFQAERYARAGIPGPFVQDNRSRSKRGVLRGLHYQPRHPQGKLVYVTLGEVFDVAVDVRHGSPTFGRWFGSVLSDRNHLQLYLPPGFAHGFCALSEFADVIYKSTDYYHPEDEAGLLWSDPDVGIRWPVAEPLLSERDRAQPRLREIPPGDLPVFPGVA